MADVELPTGTLDLRHPSNCLNIATARSGETIRVLVRRDDGPITELTEAMGTLSNDGQVKFVTSEKMASWNLTTQHPPKNSAQKPTRA